MDNVQQQLLNAQITSKVLALEKFGILLSKKNDAVNIQKEKLQQIKERTSQEHTDYMDSLVKSNMILEIEIDLQVSIRELMAMKK